MNLIERITDEMATDTDNMAKQSAMLADTYTSADEAGKKLLDDAFVCLCGWSMKTLLEQQAADPDRYTCRNCSTEWSGDDDAQCPSCGEAAE